jgi:pimeloyl-ACP methyl ester carboxylesterase
MFIDLPGHGKSAMPADLSVDALAQDLEYVLNYFDIRNAILYGHSLGAMAIMKYCIDNPNAPVKGIIIQHSTHTNVLTTTKLAPILVPLQNSVIIPFLKFSLRNYPLIWSLSIFNHLNGLGLLFYRFLYFTGRQTSAQINFKMRIAALTSPKTVAWALLELVNLDLTNDLQKIQVPALILAAHDDRLTTTEANEFISSQIKGSQLQYVRTGHLSVMENFNEVNAKVNRFAVGLGFRR